MYKGPAIPIRPARLFRGTGDCLNIYDYQNHELQIGPFDYKAWPNADKYYLLPGNLFTKIPDISLKEAQRAVAAYIERLLDNKVAEVGSSIDKMLRQDIQVGFEQLV